MVSIESMVSPGNGVPRRGVIKETKVTSEEKQPGQPGAEYSIDPDGKWCEEASFENQLNAYPGTCKKTGIKVKLFTLPEDEEPLNDLLAKIEPHGAPRVMLEGGLQKEFHDGKYYVLVSYREVSYLKLIPKRT